MHCLCVYIKILSNGYSGKNKEKSYLNDCSNEKTVIKL